MNLLISFRIATSAYLWKYLLQPILRWSTPFMNSWVSMYQGFPPSLRFTLLALHAVVTITVAIYAIIISLFIVTVVIATILQIVLHYHVCLKAGGPMVSRSGL